MAKMARAGKAGTIRGIPPAFIDPPEAFAPLEEWIAYRDSLQRSGIPYIASIIREADRHIARLRQGKQSK